MSAGKGKKNVLKDLLHESLLYDLSRRREDKVRQARLKVFLDGHQHASQWAVCLRALQDAREHGVTPTDSMVVDAIKRCGLRGKLREAKYLYTQFFKDLQRPRPLAAHVAFMEACASAGNFAEARKQLTFLEQRDVHCFQSNKSHVSLVTDDLVTAYLRSALAAHVRGGEGDTPTNDVAQPEPEAASAPAPPADSAWAVALRDLVRLRTAYSPSLFRHRVALTPLLLESAAQLADAGGQWEWTLRLLKSASQQLLLIPPEAYDAAVRVCYRHGRHGEVVSVLQTMIASKCPPDERSVRLALVSAEEVTAAQREHSLVASPAPEESGAWTLALQLLQSLRLNGLPLQQQSYESPLRACALAGQWERALDVLREMRRDARPVSVSLYRLAWSARIDSCRTYDEVERLLRLESLQGHDSGVSVLFLSAMRWCVRHADWKHLSALDREMKARELPETYDKIKLMMEAAYFQQNYHAVMARFARWHNIISYEQQRVRRDGTARAYPHDFSISLPLLDLVLDAYQQLGGTSSDPVVDVAYRAAIETRQRLYGDDKGEIHGKTQSPSWMYSRAERADNEGEV